MLLGLKPIQDVIDINGLYTEGVVRLTSKVLSIVGLPCTYKGSIIQLPSIALDVRFGCNGLEAVMIYTIAVIAFPSTWKKRIIGIALGFLIIQVINILRIAALAYSGVYFRSLFEYIHIYCPGHDDSRLPGDILYLPQLCNKTEDRGLDSS
ncbi:MAG: archaeosortase/exosortase family protein [Thermodesulfovibrionales bacterium]